MRACVRVCHGLGDASGGSSEGRGVEGKIRVGGAGARCKDTRNPGGEVLNGEGVCAFGLSREALVLFGRVVEFVTCAWA